MKKFICSLLAVLFVTSSFATNTFAIQDDVKKAYINELAWINKISPYNTYIEYCVYDINKDGYKELCVMSGTCEADYMFRFYGCEYGKIVSLGSYPAGHSALFDCNGNGIFVYRSHMGHEALYRVSKNGHSLNSTTIFDRDINYLFEAGVADPWSPPKTMLTMYDSEDYSGLY